MARRRPWVAGGLLGGFTIGIKENNRQDIVQALTARIPGLTQLGRPSAPRTHSHRAGPRRSSAPWTMRWTSTWDESLTP
jgi:hypothetical protein